MNILPRINLRSDKTDEEFENDLIRYEAKIGGQLFGPIPKNHDRQFFCLDGHTWIWHEQWRDDKGKVQSVVTKYYIRPSGVIKSQNGGAYSKLSTKETTNLVKAARIYVRKIQNEYAKALKPAV